MELQRFRPAYLNSIFFLAPVMWDSVVGSFLWKFAGSKFLEGGLSSIFGVTPVRTGRQLWATLRFLHMSCALNVTDGSSWDYLDDAVSAELLD